MKAWKQTLFHTLELAIVILAAFVISKLFNISSEDMQAIIALVIAAFVKYARVSPKVPIKDYVDGDDK